MTEQLHQRLIGTWELVSYETIDAEGGRGRPYGEAVGRLDYDAAGHMSGQVMRPNRARVELGEGSAQQVRAAYTGYIAYFGTYELSSDGRGIVHRVRGSLNPAWVGGEQFRAMRFDGDHLVLQADVTKAGEIVHHVLTWRKVG